MERVAPFSAPSAWFTRLVDTADRGADAAALSVSCPMPRTPAGRLVDSAQAFAEALLEESLVALVPGEDFGACAAGNIRISFACAESTITEGLARLRAFVQSLR